MTCWSITDVPPTRLVAGKNCRRPRVGGDGITHGELREFIADHCMQISELRSAQRVGRVFENPIKLTDRPTKQAHLLHSGKRAPIWIGIDIQAFKR